MLQRSPTYVVSRPGEDDFANWLKRHLPPMPAYGIVRWRNVLMQLFFFRLARKRPQKIKNFLVGLVKKELPDYDVETHFTPRYNPWDQRVCLVPDSDLFEAIRGGKASVVTDRIERFTETGIRLKSGKELDADIVVTATGLKLELLGGMTVAVDGAAVNMSRTMGYKGMMYSGVPNLASAFGYTNASWTLKCDLTCEYVCRMLNYMDAKGYAKAVPPRDPNVGEAPWLDFSSGYVQRALDILPKQGTERPWKLYQNYALDIVTLRFGRIDDGTMQFSKAPAKPARIAEPEAMAAE
jgi:cation diffusion facilitator CzcD-associated flavoprotein CzcO